MFDEDDEDEFFLDPDEDPEGMMEMIRMLNEQMFEAVSIPVDITMLPSEIGASGWTVSHSLE